ncbi:MAG TPA: RecX family transcriptional regulator [Candidatus Saccharimonadales bacterium]
MKITAIKQQVRRADRYSVYVDEKYAFSLSESALLEQRLASGQEIDKVRLKDLKDVSGADKAYGNALRYAVMRPRSLWEMQAYLKRKKIEEPVANDIVARLTKNNLINDTHFASAWIANRRLLKSTSKRRLILELRQKHVSEHIIDAAMQDDVVSERDSLRQIVQKKHARYPDRTKFMQYLARQGFGYDDIKFVFEENGIN